MRLEMSKKTLYVFQSIMRARVNFLLYKYSSFHVC